MRFALLVFATCLVLLTSGCGELSHTVSGTVTVDGAPLPEGYIAFIPAESGAGGGSNIVNGKYTVKTGPGKHRVEITASKLTPLPPGQVGMNGEKEEVRQYLPTRYNSNSELTAEVPGSGPLDFPLTTQ